MVWGSSEGLNADSLHVFDSAALRDASYICISQSQGAYKHYFDLDTHGK